MQFWHYTKMIAVPKILRDGEIKRTVTYFQGDRPCVWFSTNENWDNGAGTLVQCDIGDIVSCDPVLLFGFGYGAIIPARIRLNPDAVKLITWAEHQQTLPGWVAMRKELGGRLIVGANTAEWWVCYEDVPIKSCLLPIEKRVDGKWVAN